MEHQDDLAVIMTADITEFRISNHIPAAIDKSVLSFVIDQVEVFPG